jgi:FKBP-type peptidyl-prolyl cis-trans isomerase FkpA
MRTRLVAAVLLSTATILGAQQPEAPAAAAAETSGSETETLRALGFTLWRNLSVFDLSAEERAVVLDAIRDAAAGVEPPADLDAAGPKLQALARARSQRRAETEKQTGREFLDKAAAEPGAAKTEAGFVYRELAPGAGATPTAEDTVRVHYRGTLLDGTVFDSSYERGEPTEFPLKRVVRCWTEGLQMMKPGGKARLVCPSDLAYGDRGRPGIPAGATLVFEIELIEVVGAGGAVE